MLSCAAWGKASLIRTDWAKKDFYFHTSHSHYVSPYRRRYKEFFFPFNHLETQDYVIYVMSGTIFPTSRGEKKNHFERAGLESRSSCLAVDLSNHLTMAPRSMDIMINCYTVFVLASERKFSSPRETLKVFLQPLKLLKSWFMKTLRHSDWTFELLERWKSLRMLQTSENTLQGTLGQILKSLVVEQAWTRAQRPGQNYRLAVKKPQAGRIAQWIAFSLCT